MIDDYGREMTVEEAQREYNMDYKAKIAEIHAEMAERAKNVAVINQYHGTPYPTRAEDQSWSLDDRLAMRMGVRYLHQLPFDHMTVVANPKGSSTIIFAIKEGKPLTFEDDPGLFPSDSLIGKLNLLR